MSASHGRRATSSRSRPTRIGSDAQASEPIAAAALEAPRDDLARLSRGRHHLVDALHRDWNEQWDEQWVSDGDKSDFRLVNHDSGRCLDADSAGDLYTLPCQRAFLGDIKFWGPEIEVGPSPPSA